MIQSAARERRGIGWYLRGLVGLVGELMITLGVALGLFVAWQLFWTDVVADSEQAGVVATLQVAFDDGSGGSGQVQPAPVEFGEAFAIVRIPRFGADYARPLYEGTDRATLMKGIGHYPTTVLPGKVGNFSMAGHRTTYGKPFSQIAELREGDAVIVETAESWFVYRVASWKIVLPTQVEVVLPVPGEPGVEPTEAMFTMTSCHPQFSSRQRYIAHGVLEAAYPHADGVPAEVLTVTEG